MTAPPQDWDQITVADDIGCQVHMIPAGDVIGHETDPHCVCGPDWTWVGTGELFVAHWSLDRRA